MVRFPEMNGKCLCNAPWQHAPGSHAYSASHAHDIALRDLHRWGSGCPAHSPAQNLSQTRCPGRTGDGMDESRSPGEWCHLLHAGKWISSLSATGQGSAPILRVASFPSVPPV